MRKWKKMKMKATRPILCGPQFLSPLRLCLSLCILYANASKLKEKEDKEKWQRQQQWWRACGFTRRYGTTQRDAR